MNGERISLSVLASALGIKKTAAWKRGRRGMPLHDIEAARAWSRQNVDLGRERAARMSMSSGGSTDADDAPRDDDLEDFRRARARREQLRAEREALELDRARGRTADLAEVNLANFTVWRALRDRIEAVPSRVAAAVAAESDPRAVEALLDAELADVLAFDPAKAFEEQMNDDSAEE